MSIEILADILSFEANTPCIGIFDIPGGFEIPFWITIGFSCNDDFFRPG